MNGPIVETMNILKFDDNMKINLKNSLFVFLIPVKEERTVSFNVCPKIQKLLKSHENALKPCRIRVYIMYEVIHFYLVSKKSL